MLVIESLLLLRQTILKLKQEDKSIALVPTMGNLHNGHIKLIDQAKLLADIVIVSIFINPMQFNCKKDLDSYPRTVKEDCEILNKLQVDFLFFPTIKSMYCQSNIKNSTYVHVPIISEILEGVSRPNHFRGVSTIISKLFNLIHPDFACFGEKDYQQLFLIRRMVDDMNYYINISSIPIIRDKDGLALSSRNQYLTKKQRKIAPNLYKIINMMEKQLILFKLKEEKIIDLAKQEINKQDFLVDEIQIRDADTLFRLKKNSKRGIILVSAWLGKVRLIDNKIVNLK